MNRLKEVLHKKVKIVNHSQSDLSYGHSPRGEEVELTASDGTVRELTVLLLALVPVLLLFHACHGSGNDTYFRCRDVYASAWREDGCWDMSSVRRCRPCCTPFWHPADSAP